MRTVHRVLISIVVVIACLLVAATNAGATVVGPGYGPTAWETDSTYPFMQYHWFCDNYHIDALLQYENTKADTRTITWETEDDRQHTATGTISFPTPISQQKRIGVA